MGKNDSQVSLFNLYYISYTGPEFIQMYYIKTYTCTLHILTFSSVFCSGKFQ